MRLKLDAFTWIVLALVVFLVVAAVVTVNLTNERAAAPAEYMDEDSPAAPVFNAILAVQQGDVVTARAQFSESALDDYDKRDFDAIANAAAYYGPGADSRRVRIVKVSEVTQADGREIAYVTIGEDNFYGGGLFGRTTYSSERVIRVVREDGHWKVDDPGLF